MAKVSKSKSQISVGERGRLTPKRKDRCFDRMRKHATLHLAIEIVLGMMLQQEWTVEGDDDDKCQFLWQQLEPYRKYIIRSAFLGFVVNGWKSFEIVYGTGQTEFGMRQTIDAIKALKPELTSMVIDQTTGNLLGMFNKPPGLQEEVFIDALHTLFVNQDDDGYGEYGTPIFEIAKQHFEAWELCEDGSQRYDEKVAGGFLLVKFPTGSTPYSKNSEAETDNAIIADDLAQAVRSGGYATVPIRVEDELDPTNSGSKLVEMWQVDHIAAGGGLQPNFILRSKYCDAMLLRAFGIPERAATEGTLGTKAEAEAHADIAILVNTGRHGRIADAVNSQIVQPFNESNWGQPGACRVVVQELDADDREMFKIIFTGLMQDPLFGESVAQLVDIQALCDKLQIPVNKGVVLQATTPTPSAAPAAGFSEGNNDGV